MKNLEQTYQVVEQALKSLEIEPESSRNDEAGQWTVYREDLELYVDVWSTGKEQQGLYYFEADDYPVFQVICPFCQMPEKDGGAFLQEIGDINIQMYKATLAVRSEGGVVCVKYRNLAMDLKEDEVVEALHCVGYYAELFSKVFWDKYKTPLLHRQDEE